MKKWKRILCIAMAAMLSCPPVSVHAGEPEETYTLKMETDGTENVLETGTEVWMTEEALDTEVTEETETEEIFTTEVTESTEVTEAAEEISEDIETELQEETEEIYSAANTKQPENPVYNEDTDSTKWSYVYFGRYPQNEVTGDDLDDSIINANYNKNGDAVVNGVKYRRVDEGDGDKPKWSYYSYEPIKWRVLQNDGSTLLLLTDEAIFEAPYEYGWYKYITSKVRSMLNGYNELENSEHKDYSVKGTNLLSMAFYAKEQDIMQILPLQDTGAQDLVRVPTSEEITNSKYGFGRYTDSYTCKFHPTRYQYGSDWDGKEGCDCIYNEKYTKGGTSEYSVGCPLIQISLDSDLWSMDCPQTSFEAKNLDAASVSVTIKKNNYVYDGKAKEPKITVKDGNETLTQDIDYTVTYLNNVQAGTAAAVRIDGTGDYVGSKTTYFTIEKANQTIAVNKNITKKTTDKKFKIGAQLTAGNGALSYQSDNTSVAQVDRYGNVTIYGGGVANITVTAKETVNYNSATVKVKLTVQKNKPTLAIAKTKFTKAYGDKAFWIEAESEDDVDITFSSNNKKVVTVNGEGKVSIKGCGTAKITVATVADSKYDSTKKTIKITVKPKKSTITSLASKKKTQMVLKWKKDSKASGYEIVYSYNGKSKKVDVKKNGTTSATIKRLKSKKTYSVKIRAYKKVDGKKIYGDYSKVKKIKVK
ncbi:MAG: fibronectin type III domain-containing protein [Roseburia intestinalis]|mgnify:FL=1|nr:fibronectin type III domain-containing protein [Roseburia intestinalis]